MRSVSSLDNSTANEVYIGGSRGGGGGHFRHMPPPPPLLGQMWVCPNRKMNMHVEHAPSPFRIEVGVVVRKKK